MIPSTALESAPSIPRRTIGAALAVLGFGIAQALQGRWLRTGWIFTIGQLAALLVLIIGRMGFSRACWEAGMCKGFVAPALVIGAILFGALYLWGVVDGFVGAGQGSRTMRKRDRTTEISRVMHLGGVAVAMIGFGLGQLIQQRWRRRGWVMTVGQLVALIVMVIGLGGVDRDCFESDSNCRGYVGPALFGGLLVFVVLHLWGIIDAIVAPVRHNARLRGQT